MRASIILAFAALGLVTAPAAAHRQWMLPSSTVVSGDDVWITVDAAVSNDLFYLEHNPIRLDNIRAIGPDGAALAIENAATGKFRSVFDVHLTQRGTHKITNNMSGIGGTFVVDGKQQRLPRGTTADQLATAIPAGATDVKLTEMTSRNEIFITAGAPTDTVLRIEGKGLEFRPETHPNDLVAGESARFVFLIDGKPAPGVTVTVIPGGVRYRDQLGDRNFTTDADGAVSVDWPAPGLYWLNATMSDAKTSVPGAGQRRMSYVATLEVLAP